MLSDDRERLKEALAKLEAEKNKRAAQTALPYRECEGPGGEILRVYTGVPRTEEESAQIKRYLAANPRPEPPAKTACVSQHVRVHRESEAGRQL
jgi:hypothetical protein